MQSPSFRVLAFALALCCCATAHAQSTATDDAIVFRRDTVDPQTGATVRGLFLITPDGITTTQVTAPRDGDSDDQARWSSDGTHLVFTRHRGGREGDLFVIDRAGRHATRLTGPQRDEQNAVWGPGRLIAFESAPSDPYPDCLHLVGWPRQVQQERELFCAIEDDGDPTEVMSPSWSPDGRSVYVTTSHPVGRLGEVWYGDVHRVDVATGVATRAARTTLDEQSFGLVSPDGRTALFRRSYGEGVISLIDLDDGSKRTLGGMTPVFSSDGRQLAYVRTVFVGEVPDYMLLEQVFIADVETGNVRQVTDHRDEQLHLATIDWSGDGTQLLVQHSREGETTQRLAILDVTTGQLRPLVEGTATEGAWFHH